MALPSQTERQTEIGRSYVYSRRTQTAAGGTRLVLIIAASLVLAAGLVWGLLNIVTRRSATGTLPPADAKTEIARSVTQPKPASTPSIASLTPTSEPAHSPKDLTPAGVSSQTPMRTDAPIAPPANTPTTSTSPVIVPSSTPKLDPSGRPTPVDVTRPDLAPDPTPAKSNATAPEQPTSLAPAGSTSEVAEQIQAAEQRAAAGDLVQARVLFNKALHNPNVVRDDQERIRQRMAAINADLLFSAKVFAGDPMSETYVVKSGDNLIKITRNREVATDWRLIERINGVKGNTLRVGQKLKLVRGPFHAIVHKGDYRLDLFQGSPDDPESWVYIRSFKVGLGTGNSTPVGNFVVKPRSKLVNPPWVNPQTGQKFAADDPKNPIGEYWMGIEGVGDSKTITGYGLHGTIEPDSIGQQKSMGCVRLGDEDIKLLYEMLVEQISDVKIVP